MQSVRRALLRTATAVPRFAVVAPPAPMVRMAARPAAAVFARAFTQTTMVRNEEPAAPAAPAEPATPAESAESAAPAAPAADSQTTDAFSAVASKPRPDMSIEETPYGVFVRNMVFDATEANLKEAFETYGRVRNVTIARDPRGLSRGYGFVWFETEEGQKRAITDANESFWHGRRISVRERSPSTRGQRNQSSGGSHVLNNAPSATLYIGNLPYETTDADLNVVFRDLKGLDAVRVSVDRATGWPRGFAHADFKTVEDAMAACEALIGKELGGRSLRIDYAAGANGRRGTPRREQPGRSDRSDRSD